MLLYTCYGACRQAVKTSDCGSDMHGFESHQAPHFLEVMLENFRSKGYYKFGGVISWIIALLALYCIIYAKLPHGFASLGAGFLSVFFFLGLVILYAILLLTAIFDFKRIVDKSTNNIIDTGYILGLITIISFICIIVF